MELNIKNCFKYIALSILVLFTSQSMAVTVSEAVSASENNDAVKAVRLWSQLASAGNTIAQYNLATYYSSGNGVEKNKQVARKWLKDATRSGFVQAYLNLNKSAIAPAKGVTLKFNIENPLTWLAKQEPKKYTIQLASSRNENSIKQAFEDNRLKGKGGYYHYVREGVDRYALIFGSFKTVAAANVAIKDLPEKLRKKTPWVRKIKSLQYISK
jgi:septal ring-binding cell division protein DamX